MKGPVGGFVARNLRPVNQDIGEQDHRHPDQQQDFG
jgi:hypothetical protein